METITGQLNTELNAPVSEQVVKYLLENGIITPDVILNIDNMNKKNAVLRIHPYKIWQSNDSYHHFMTYISDEDSKYGRKKIVKNSECDIFLFLYDFYFGKESMLKKFALPDIYEEWIQYKLTTCNRTSTVRRLETDYRRFYLNEPLSEKIMSTPLLKLTVADIKEWAYSLIKKYELKKSGYYAATTILRQVYDYLIEKEITERNPCKLVKINSGAFKKDYKKPAETQIFYQDEVEMITNYCIKRAKEDLDVGFMAIPLFFQTGLRIGECLGLSFSDCHKDKNMLFVHRMLAVKDERLPDGTWKSRGFEIVDFLKGNGEPREVLVTNQCFELIQIVKDIMKASLIVSDLMFPQISESNVQLKLYRACKELGIRKRSPHKGRKTYISTLLNNGMDPDFVRTQVGYREIQTTLNSYTYSTTRDEEKVKQLNNILAI